MAKILLEQELGISNFGTALSTSGVAIPCNVKDDGMFIVLNGKGTYTIVKGDSDYATGDLTIDTTDGDVLSVVYIETAKYKNLNRKSGDAYGCIVVKGASTLKAGVIGRGIGNGLYYSPALDESIATSDPVLANMDSEEIAKLKARVTALEE